MTPARAAACATLLLAAAIALGAGAAAAQEFAFPAALPAAGDALLERGLPSPRDGFTIAALHVARAAPLATRSLAASAGFRGARLAAGLSRTGDATLGWSAAAAALGWAGEGGGIGLRALVRRDDAAPPGEAAAGSEIGGGAWVDVAGARLWVSAPQAGLGGVLPPLARGVTAGADWGAAGCLASLAREAPRRGFAEAAAWSARVGLAFGGLAVWGELREQPWRGGIGVAADAGPLRCAAAVDAHPVLPPTTRIALALRAPERRR